MDVCLYPSVYQKLYSVYCVLAPVPAYRNCSTIPFANISQLLCHSISRCGEVRDNIIFTTYLKQLFKIFMLIRITSSS